MKYLIFVFIAQSKLNKNPNLIKNFKIFFLVAAQLQEITYFLFTSSNPEDPQIIFKNDSNSLLESNFNSSDLTLVYIHGYNGGINDRYIPKIKKAMQNRGSPYNLIFQDWSVLGKNDNYLIAKDGVEPAGKDLALFIQFLQTEGNVSLSNLVLSGHSLGAHVAGFCGKNMPKDSRIKHIVGLDPAGVFFSNPNQMLNSTDAEYVETIQTNGNGYGYYYPIGTAAFYPNGGVSQLGCSIWDMVRCSHDRSCDYFAEALEMKENNAFSSKSCKDFTSMVYKLCTLPENPVRMGDLENPGKAKGVYYLETNGVSPYGKGL